MIIRRIICLALVFGFAFPCFGFTQNNDAEINKQFTADVLKTTLVAKTPDEKKFCDYVIQKRDDGTIPARLIYGVYQKAIAKERDRRFTYFKAGLEIVCKREGIVLNSSSIKTQQTKPALSLPSFKNFF